MDNIYKSFTKNLNREDNWEMLLIQLNGKNRILLGDRNIHQKCVEFDRLKQEFLAVNIR